ncbi:tRNA (guanosine(37)-N1)-methyltransferase TrmD [Egicoccus halophilus]|uniref:tRNA (guanine-N(1)-)-methyltransferase n=1 Tax=Egicoccus halophilus TaxID=1670830 RepID=A0A8J3A851_9ACTN|nr:tRNA (guanine-N(1)-)-methyltransferase [Egicoccus halophilus]
MRIDVLTIFPDWFDGPLTTSLLAKAHAAGLLDLRVHDLRAFTTDRHRTVDATPYGGGAGMVMRADVWVNAAEAVWNDLPPATTAGAHAPPADAPFVAGGERPRTLLLTPRGRPLTQAYARELAAEPRLVLCCGRYEGIDERAHDLVATDEVSIGDYVLFGGEVAAAVVIETVTRLVPGVLGNHASPEDESFSSGLLEYPHYTRPATLRGHGVPEVLTSGDHGAVARWRTERAEELTRRRRPDLLAAPDDHGPRGNG